MNNKQEYHAMASAGDWNRENAKPHDYDASLSISQPARILVVGSRDDLDSQRLFDNSQLPESSSIVRIGTKKEDFDVATLKQENPPTVMIITTKGIRELVAELVLEFADTLKWIHVKSAGIEHVTSETLAKSSVIMTNAKGHFSSTLAEYGMLAIGYFAKDLPRLMQQQGDSRWEKYNVMEIRGATLGIVGFGDIGQATAKLAKAYGMKVIALKRKAGGTAESQYCDKIYYSQENPSALNQLCAESDYIYVALPLTPQTTGLIGHEQFQKMKSTGVIINVGRGPVLDEAALIDALKSGAIKGAGLDVFTEEPLPKGSLLWSMKNVLLSPHNMDQTATFQQEATDFFLDENLPRFLRGLPLYNVVDKSAGY